MVDEEWLNQLQTDLGQGYWLDKIGVGGQGAVLSITCPDGAGQAMKLIPNPFGFASYIREIPNWLVPSPQYDLDHLNYKLADLLGDPLLHILVRSYDLLFSSILEFFYAFKEPNLDSILMGSEDKIWIPRFVVRTPAISYRLENFATGKKYDQERRAWAEESLARLEQAGPGDPDLLPETLFDNPLFVWGGAVLEGYFAKAEFPRAIAAVKEQLNLLPKEQIEIFLWQMYAIMSTFYGIEGVPKPSRLSVFCDATGFYSVRFSTDEEWAAPDEFALISRQLAEHLHP
jgi:hypothetical protein